MVKNLAACFCYKIAVKNILRYSHHQPNLQDLIWKSSGERPFAMGIEIM